MKNELNIKGAHHLCFCISFLGLKCSEHELLFLKKKKCSVIFPVAVCNNQCLSKLLMTF